MAASRNQLQVMLDKDHQAACTQITHGADELRMSQHRILANKADPALQASQAVQHLQQEEADITAAAHRVAIQEQQKTQSVLHHAQVAAVAVGVPLLLFLSGFHAGAGVDHIPWRRG
jgi:hypothetical protein